MVVREVLRGSVRHACMQRNDPLLAAWISCKHKRNCTSSHSLGGDVATEKVSERHHGPRETNTCATQSVQQTYLWRGSSTMLPVLALRHGRVYGRGIRTYVLFCIPRPTELIDWYFHVARPVSSLLSLLYRYIENMHIRICQHHRSTHTDIKPQGITRGKKA